MTRKTKRDGAEVLRPMFGQHSPAIDELLKLLSQTSKWQEIRRKRALASIGQRCRKQSSGSPTTIAKLKATETQSARLVEKLPRVASDFAPPPKTLPGCSTTTTHP